MVIVMKRKVRPITVALPAVLLPAMLLTACGSKEYLKDINAAEYVTLGNYIGVEVEAEAPELSDEEVDQYINTIMIGSAQTVEVTDRAIEKGDIVSIDYTGRQGDETFDSGSYDLEIGSGSFIEGFEDGLIGHELGEQVTLNLTFPDPYNPNPDLSGKPAEFDVTINAIKMREIPELNDEFVESMGMEDCKTVEEFRDFVYNMLYDSKTASYEEKIINTITDSVMAGCTFKELPEEFVDRYYNNMIKGMTAQASGMGTTLDLYMINQYGMDATVYPQVIRENATLTAQQIVMFQAIADAENITLSDEEVEEEIKNRAADYGYISEEEFKANVELESFKEYLMSEKVMDFLMENAKINPPAATEEQ